MQRTKKCYLAVFIILLCMGLIACKNNSSDTEGDNILVELTNIEDTEIVTDTNPQENASQRLIKVIKHDAGFSEDGTTWDLITEYEYSQEGYLIREISYDSDGNLLDDNIEYSYDNNGNMIRKSNYVKDSLIRYITYKYNQKNQLIKEEAYINWGDSSDSFIMTSETEYTYDSNDKCIKAENKSGEIVISSEYSYDDNNRLIKKEGSNGYVENYYYTSDENDLLEKKVVSVPEYSTTYYYTYDSNRNLIEEIIESDNGNSPGRITYEYEDIN